MATSRASNVSTKDSTSTACQITSAATSANKTTSTKEPARTITPSSNYTSYGIHGSTLTFLLPQAQGWDYFRIALTCQPRPFPFSEGSHPNSVAKVDIQMNLLRQPPASLTLLIPNAVLKSFPAGQSIPWVTWHPKTRFVMNSPMTGHCIGVSDTQVLRAHFSRLFVWNFDKTSRKGQAKTTVNDDIWLGEIVTNAPYDELILPKLALCDQTVFEGVLPLLGYDCILVPKAFKDASGCVSLKLCSSMLTRSPENLAFRSLRSTISSDSSST